MDDAWSAGQQSKFGVKLPCLADEFIVNFDDERAKVGFRVLEQRKRAPHCCGALAPRVKPG
jgi:hypothetical protein